MRPNAATQFLSLADLGAWDEIRKNAMRDWYRSVEWFERHVLGWDMPVRPDDLTVKKALREGRAVASQGPDWELWDAARRSVDAREYRLVADYHWHSQLLGPDSPSRRLAEPDLSQVAAVEGRLMGDLADMAEWREARAAGKLAEYWAARPGLRDRVLAAATAGSGASTRAKAAAAASPAAAARAAAPAATLGASKKA